ncbi:hypothetical protein IF1G_08994 [Cordyceps javanica]|uniref:Uncharacterized protein n=1 Tax=Cordyceps javanica TaxID=43265 RepID=A0A545USP7_9HYPO|nr:hypothetical protein IF1G_08994 [Cordyceps javanica]
MCISYTDHTAATYHHPFPISPCFLAFTVCLGAAAVAACNAPRAEGSDALCTGGKTYTDCVQEKNKLCILECFNQPPGPCQSGCITRSQTDCAIYCPAINNCDDCIKAYTTSGQSEDQARQLCSVEGKCLRYKFMAKAAAKIDIKALSITVTAVNGSDLCEWLQCQAAHRRMGRF